MPLKLKYHTSLYLGRSIPGEKLDRIKNRLSKHPIHACVFVVAVSGNSHDQLEIYSSGMLVQRYYQSHPPFIVGIARDYLEAVALVEQIVKDCLAARGDCALKEYLLC